MAGKVLTDRQRLFIIEYMKSLNATQAYLAAYKGCNTNTAKREAYRLLNEPNVKKELKRLRLEFFNDAECSIELIVNELKAIGFMNFYAIVKKLEKKEELTESEQKAIAGFEKTQDFLTTKIKYKAHDKIKALELLGKHKAMFTDKLEHTGNISIHFDKEDEKL